jgi:hypothetical protein
MATNLSVSLSLSQTEIDRPAPAPEKKMARRRGGGPAAAVASPAVVGTVAVMALVYYSTLFVFLDHWLGLATPAGAAHAAAVSLAVAACFFAFVCAAAADPGSVPASFAPDAEAAQGQVGPTEISLPALFALLALHAFIPGFLSSFLSPPCRP